MNGDERVFSGNRLVESVETETEVISTDIDSVEKIIYHTPMGEGDLHFVDVFYTDGEVIRFFNPSAVTWRERN